MAEETRQLKGRTLDGTVVRKSGDKTVAVEVTRVSRHPLYGKKVVRTKRFLVHDAENAAEVGQQVQIQETRPRSKRKRWSLVTAQASAV